MLREIIIKLLMIVNLAEGVIHIVGSAVSFYGMYDIGIWDWRVGTSPILDMFLGMASLLTGFCISNYMHKCSCEKK